MRLRLAFLALSLLLLPQRAHALDFDLALNGGIGAFFGPGWDANRPGGSLTIAGGPRVYDFLSVHGALQLQDFHLRTEERDPQQGELFALLLAPEVRPLGTRDGATPYLTPLMGYSYLIARVTDPGAKVRSASRAAIIGGAVGCVWPFGPSYWLGANVVVVRLFAGKSCIQSDAGGTSCGALERNDTRVGALQLTFRMTIGDR